MTAAIRAVPLAEGEVCQSEEMRGRGGWWGEGDGAQQSSRFCFTSRIRKHAPPFTENHSYCGETCTNITPKVTYKLRGREKKKKKKVLVKVTAAEFLVEE